MKKMDIEIAIEKIKNSVCCGENGLCKDNCMYGADFCEFGIAINALKKIKGCIKNDNTDNNTCNG